MAANRSFKRHSTLILIIFSIIIGNFSACNINQDNQLIIETSFIPVLNENVTRGTFEVFENPNIRKGKKVRIKFIILSARTSSPAPDPIFVFHGGPGVGAADDFESWARQLDKLRNEREIVLIDQRGTGGSNPLPCFFPGDQTKAQTYLNEILPVEYVMNCKKELEKQYNLRYYHTVVAIDDTDALRVALGYDKINLYGVSYGSYFAMVYMKHYRENVRSAFLHGVAPPDWSYPACLAQDTETSLQRLFGDCAADPLCQTDYPTFKEELYELFALLKLGPITTQITNPITGDQETVQFYYHNFIHIIRSLLYNTNRSSWIPAYIYWANRGTWFPLVEYTVRSVKSANESMMDGLWLCVSCSETIPFINVAKAVNDAEGTFMGTYRIDQQTRACDLWLRGDRPAGFLDPVELNIPTILLSGEIDPVTPPYHGKIMVDYLPNSLHIVVPNAGHGLGRAWENGLDEVMVQFFSQGSVSGLDPSCVNSNTRPPFVSWRDYSSYNHTDLSEVLRSLK